MTSAVLYCVKVSKLSLVLEQILMTDPADAACLIGDTAAGLRRSLMHTSPDAQHLFLPTCSQLAALNLAARTAVYCDSGYRAAIVASSWKRTVFVIAMTSHIFSMPENFGCIKFAMNAR